MRIAVDAMGGDNAPRAVVEGVALAIKELPNTVTIVLIGNQSKIEPLLQEYNIHNGVELAHADDIIAMGEHPTKALARKPNSSIGIGFQLLKQTIADAFCSAGNTGAMLVGSMFSIKSIEGIIRPAIAGFVPQQNGRLAVVLDIGANADCKPEMLEQFGELGSFYAQHTLGIAKPKVALMNIGEEEQKGSLIMQAAYQLLKNNEHIDFVGNIEGDTFFEGKADVVVCDGFTGNILLKMGESFYEIAKRRGFVDEFIQQMNYETSGGSPILGVNGNVIIAHGKSTPSAIKNMILLAKKQIESEVWQKIKQVYH